MDQISEFIAKHGFTAFVAIYFLWQNHQDKKMSRADADRMHKEIEALKGQHFQIQKDIATTLRETNRLVKRIFNIVDRGDDGDGGPPPPRGDGGDAADAHQFHPHPRHESSDTFLPAAAAASERPTESFAK